MKFKLSTENSYKYIYLIIALICTFWVITLFEVFMTASNGINTHEIGVKLWYKSINDFWTGILIGLLLFPFYLLFSFINKRFGEVIFKVVFIFLIIGQFALVKYSLLTLLNLGADLLGYSLKDVSMTVSSTSESLSFSSLLPIIFSVIFLSFNYGLKKVINSRQSMAIMIIAMVLLGSMKIMFSNISNENYTNKLYFLTKDIIRSLNEKRELNTYNFSKRNDYPLLISFDETKDVLGSFINIKEEKPNIFVIIVEGLGTEFVSGNEHSGFTPYIDSLISKSLYWENFVSNTGRTFGVLPTIFGSLPYAENGFLELAPSPSHISLISFLKTNGYTTSYFEGSQSSFDRKINFLEYNEIDFVIDQNNYGDEYVEITANSSGFSWGYSDAEIYKMALTKQGNKKEPKLNILMTQAIHTPFRYPTKEIFMSKVDSILDSGSILESRRDAIKTHKEIYASILYSDNSIRDFMQEYAKRPEYDNTIFIITGDHRLIPIPQKDKLCRFHVPFLIYSPMLKKPKRFKSISSHWDVAPSLSSFLVKNYRFNKPDKVAWMSQGLDTAQQFRNIHQIPLMRNKGSINDFIYKDYLLSNGELFKIKGDFGTYKVIEEQLRKNMLDSLKEFKKLNAYITKRNKIFPHSLNTYVKSRVDFLKVQRALINELTKGLDFDETFLVARKLAFNKEYKKARLLVDYILNEFPYHVDARTLKGRSLGWEFRYEEAKIELLNVIKKNPYEDNGYLALLDLYWWSHQEENSISIFEMAIENGRENPEIGFKMANAYQRMNNLSSANEMMDSLIERYPKNEKYKKFKQDLK